MADEAPFDALLLKFGIDLSAVKNAGAAIKDILDKANDAAKVTEQKTAQAVTAQKTAFDQVKAAAQAAVEIAKAGTAVEGAKTAEIKTQTAELQKQSAQQRAAAEESRAALAAENAKKAAVQAATAELQKQLAERRAETAEIQRQTAELRKRSLEERTTGSASRREGGGAAGLGGVLGTVTTRLSSALFGRAAGGLTGAFIAGDLIAKGIETATESLVHFIEKLKEMQEQSSQLTMVSDRFNALARGIGQDGPQMLTKMREATEGLVDKLTLSRFGMRALQSNIKSLTPDKIVELTGAVVKLAESSGYQGGATGAIHALGESMARGGARATFMLARITGLTREQLQLANIPPILNRVERATMEWDHALAVVLAKAAELGEVPRTLAQAAAQLNALVKDLLLSFGKGVNESPGMQVFLKAFSEQMAQLHSLEDVAEEAGKKLGNVFLEALPAVELVKDALTGVYSIMQELGALMGTLFGGKTLSTFELIGGIFLGIGHNVQFVILLVNTLLGILNQLAKPIRDFAEYLSSLVTGDFAAAAEKGKQFFKDLFYLPTNILDDAKQKSDKFWADRLKAIDEYQQRARELREKEGKPVGAGKVIEPGEVDESNLRNENALMQAMKQLRQTELQLEQEFQKELLDADKDYWEERKRLDTQNYTDGQESLKDHLDKQRLYAQENYQQQLASAKANFDAQQKMRAADIEDINIRQKKGLITPQVGDVERARVGVQEEQDRIKRNTAEIAARRALHATLDGLDRQHDQDQLAAKRTNIQAQMDLDRSAANFRMQIQEEAIKASEQLSKTQLQQGEISPDTFFQQRIEQITKLAQVQIERAQAVREAQEQDAKALYDAGVKNDQALAKRDAAIQKALQEAQQAGQKAIQQAQDTLRQLGETQAQVQLQAIQRTFQPRQQVLQEQYSFQQGQPETADSALSEQLLQRLLNTLAQERLALESTLALTKAGSDEWYQIQQRIEQTWQTQIKYNQELEKMKDILQPIASSLGAVSKAFGETFRQRFTQNIAESLQASVHSLSSAKDLGRQIAGRPITVKDAATQELETKASGIFDAAKASADQIRTPFNNLTDAINQTITALQKMAQTGIAAPVVPKEGTDVTEGVGQGVGTPVSFDTSNQSQLEEVDTSQLPTQGANRDTGGTYGPSKGPSASDIASRFGAAITALDNFTQSVLNAHSALSGGLGGASAGAGLGQTANSALGGMLGPFGALAGAVGGGILGAIIGQKNNQVTNNINNFTAQMRTINQEFALNNNNLNLYIQQTTQLIAQVQATMASSKKGHSQYQQLIDQFTQQLMSLQAQQNQIMVNLNEQLAQVTAPLPAQSILGDLEQIVQQFSQFEGAASNVQQLANAYQYLDSAIQNYLTTSSQQLLQDNTQAIQDAINLNDLLYQRQQMLLQYNDQVESILSQGVLTRQFTRAQSAGQQIQTLTVQFQMQMQNTNEQIAAAQYRVQAEGQIFQLSQTRVGLEGQLLALQNQQTAIDMQRIQALTQLVQALSTGNLALLPNLGNLLGAVPSVTNPVTGETMSLAQMIQGLINGTLSPSSLTGVSPTSNPSSDSATQSFANAYNDYASLGISQYNGTNL